METTEFDTIKANILDPLKEVFGSSENLERLEEVGRVFFTSETVTVNALGIILAALAVLTLGLKLIFGLSLFDVMDVMTGHTGYGTSYSTPSSGYGHDSGYSQPSGYAAPSSSYSSRSSNLQVELTPEQKTIYPELGQLQEQLQDVEDAELRLRKHIHYKEGAGDLGHNVADLIGHSY